jgi:multidrug efflux pump subunit AcrA (membrane-fusion protein)
MRSILLAAFLMGLAFAGAGQGQEAAAGRLEIVSAHWRGRDVEQDLTDALREHFRRGVPSVTVVSQRLNHTEPAPGGSRARDVRYPVNGQPRHATFQEGEKVFFRDLAELGR